MGAGTIARITQNGHIYVYVHAYVFVYEYVVWHVYE